jgi:hypothetical protein
MPAPNRSAFAARSVKLQAAVPRSEAVQRQNPPEERAPDLVPPFDRRLTMSSSVNAMICFAAQKASSTVRFEVQDRGVVNAPPDAGCSAVRSSNWCSCAK